MLRLTSDNIHLIRSRIAGAGIKAETGKAREIPIHKDILPMLRRATLNMGYIFGENDGSKITAKSYRERFFYPLMKKFGMNHTPHGCRHTTPSLLVRNKVPPELAKYILGHSVYSTTVDIYNHPQDDVLLQAINKI